jgi:hypothetical protein
MFCQIVVGSRDLVCLSIKIRLVARYRRTYNICIKIRLEPTIGELTIFLGEYSARSSFPAILGMNAQKIQADLS